ncbi:hypothetical protein ACQP2Y_21295 [Actinoplanes sp. CA-051413]|uniref:hypothetical protein n=1 Tax=Actinoplanes sp. CA-051413 TaxID=3239899 RepID=UPI003D974DF3
MSASVQRRLREDPVFAAMTADVARVRRAWPGVHVVAHRDEQSGRVSFHLHVRPADRQRLVELLGSVSLNEMRNGNVTSFHFQGSRRDMDRLLRGLGS